VKKEYNFYRGKRGPAISNRGKTQSTIYLDNATLDRFKAESERTGEGYQTLINEALAKRSNGPRAVGVPCLWKSSVKESSAVHGLRPFPTRGGVVTNELIDKLRDDDAC
jgi:hypothetical protein